MSFSTSAADERVLDVQFTDDTISVNLRDGRIVTVPLVWYPRLLEATPSERVPGSPSFSDSGNGPSGMLVRQ